MHNGRLDLVLISEIKRVPRYASYIKSICLIARLQNIAVHNYHQIQVWRRFMRSIIDDGYLESFPL